MRIGVLSDTHLRSHVRRLPANVEEAFADVDLVVHAGDAVQRGVLDALQALAPVVFVEGNCDQVRGPKRLVVHTPHHAIGVVHEAPRLLQREFIEDLFGEPIHALIHGHTHRATISWMDGVLCMNPGSPTAPRDGRRSVMVLEAAEELRPTILVLGQAIGGD